MLEVVLDTLVLNFLFLLKDLLVDRLLVLFPLIPEFLELFLDLADLILQHPKILSLEFLELTEHLLLLLRLFLHPLEVLREFLLLPRDLVLPRVGLVERESHLVHLGLYRVELSDQRGYLLLLLLLQLLHIELLLLLLDVVRLLLALLVVLLFGLGWGLLVCVVD